MGAIIGCTGGMEILPRQPTNKGPAEMFTGYVWFDVVAKGEPPARIQVNVVRFSPSARTARHRHAVGQTLHVTDGAPAPADYTVRVRSAGCRATRTCPQPSPATAPW